MNGGLFEQAESATEETRGGSVEEQANIWKAEVVASKYTNEKARTVEEILVDLGPNGQKLLTQDDIDDILNETTNPNMEITIGSKTISFKVDQVAGNNNQEEGFDSSKEVNKPSLVAGMQPIKFVGTIPTNTTDTDPEWYDYSLNAGAFAEDNTNNRQAKWANATITNTTTGTESYFVWIPRYAYKILNGEHTSTAGEIDIIFLQGTTNKDKDGNNIPSDYIVHPAFDFGGAVSRNMGRKI